ncbi:chemotaxis protein CheA [Marivita sp.]|jgi:two-component system chemotaxis sensor kinase CheA|uniref:chemotaxis protein CheA n=1 Tax=Marivita sp. TaxID=2003365 RepID=UPI00321A0A42
MSGFDDIGAEIFREEASELLQSIEKGLMDLEATPSDTELVNSIFRSMHTIKGSGAMFGFTELSQFVHEFETAFDDLRNGRAEVSKELIGLSLQACDQIGKLMDAVDGTDQDNQRILASLRQLMRPNADGAAVSAPTEETADAEMIGDQAQSTAPTATDAVITTVRFWLGTDALRLGSNPALLIDELRAFGETTVRALDDRIPTLGDLDPSDCLTGWEVEVAADLSDDDIDMVFLFVRDEMELSVEKRSAEPIAPVDTGSDNSELASTAAKPAAEPTPTQPQAAAKQTAGETMRVATERLDELMDRVGELVIAEARLQALTGATSDPAMMSVAEDIQRLVAGLRDATMSMRMVPIGSILGRFRRLMRDLSSSLNKPLDFVTVGEDTELDKTVIELLADPLVHILRNSVDHGLETPEERLAAGKPETGTIELGAKYSGAEVLITVRDDGRGLNPEKIREKAISRGLMTEKDDLSDNEIFRMIFQPGFSTVDKVTELSGRGVGMDVVMRTIGSLRGEIDLASELGKGTTLTLRLPLTLAIIDGMLIDVGGERYTIPLAAVEECVELPALHTVGHGGSSYLNIRGELVPFLRLRHLFEIDGEPPEFQKVVVVSSAGGRVGLVVDRIIGNYQTVIKQLSQFHACLKFFSGATILGDGTVALILDATQLVALGRDAELRARREAAA